MKATELLDTLKQFHKQKLTLLRRHVAAARYVIDYDFNNTYQYVINREDMHVQWVADAVEDVATALGHTDLKLDDVAEPEVSVSGKGKAAQSSVFAQDRDSAKAFVEKWRPIVDTLKHARHRTMLNVVLGESLEHRRLFEQAAAGFEDVLGKRTTFAERVGAVLPTRWQE